MNAAAWRNGRQNRPTDIAKRRAEFYNEIALPIESDRADSLPESRHPFRNRNMRWSSSLIVAFIGAALATAEEKNTFDAKKLEGSWTYVEGKRSGDAAAKESLQGKVTFTKDTITVPAGPDMKFTMAFKINAKANPVEIDIEIKDGPVNEGKAVGIIEVTGDTLKLCYSAANKRPKKFESTKDNGAFYFVLKRAPK